MAVTGGTKRRTLTEGMHNPVGGEHLVEVETLVTNAVDADLEVGRHGVGVHMAVVRFHGKEAVY